MSSHPFYFIHNYKTAGTTIISQLPKSYQKYLYGRPTFNELKKIYLGLKINKIKAKYPINEKISIDHLSIDNLVEFGLLKLPPKKIKFMMIMRDPIKRFISICNFHNQHKNQHKKEGYIFVKCKS